MVSKLDFACDGGFRPGSFAEMLDSKFMSRYKITELL